MDLKFKLADGSRYYLSNFYIGQGHYSSNNNLWIGAGECEFETANDGNLMCPAGDDDNEPVYFKWNDFQAMDQFSMTIAE